MVEMWICSFDVKGITVTQRFWDEDGEQWTKNKHNREKAHSIYRMPSDIIRHYCVTLLWETNDADMDIISILQSS